MTQPIRILLQTTITTTEDDWSIARFSLLRDYLAALKDEAGNALCEVTARDRADADNDPILRPWIVLNLMNYGCLQWIQEMD